VYDGFKTQKLKNKLENIVKRHLRNANQRIIGGGNVIKGAMTSIINGLKNVPKKNLKRWRIIVEDIQKKRLFDNARTAKLQNALSKIPVRTLKESVERVKGIIFSRPVVKKSLGRLEQVLKRKPKQAFDRWRKFAQAVGNNFIMNNLKSQILLNALNKVPKRVLRDAVQRIIGDGSKVKGAIKQIYNTLLRKPKTAFDKWNLSSMPLKKRSCLTVLGHRNLKAHLKE